jgi:hypothetical protein
MKEAALQLDLEAAASYFNAHNGHWEPAIEPWNVVANAELGRVPESDADEEAMHANTAAAAARAAGGGGGGGVDGDGLVGAAGATGGGSGGAPSSQSSRKLSLEDGHPGASAAMRTSMKQPTIRTVRWALTHIATCTARTLLPAPPAPPRPHRSPHRHPCRMPSFCFAL